jgi:opine dehydrogenase
MAGLNLATNDLEKVMVDTKVAIVGAGSGGVYLAAELGRLGAQLRLTDLNDARLADIRAHGGLDVEANGQTALSVIERVTTDLAIAVDGADVIAVCTGGNSQEGVARGLAPLLRDGQTILLIQGNTGGALTFRRALDGAGCRAQVDIAEMDNYPYSCWRDSPTHIRPIVAKKFLQIAAFPGTVSGRCSQSSDRFSRTRSPRPPSPQPASPTQMRCCMSPIASPMPARSTAARVTNSTPRA